MRQNFYIKCVHSIRRKCFCKLIFKRQIEFTQNLCKIFNFGMKSEIISIKGFVRCFAVKYSIERFEFSVDSGYSNRVVAKNSAETGHMFGEALNRCPVVSDKL